MTADRPAFQGFDEALRRLYLLAVEPDLPFCDKVGRLLELGSAALGLELGIVSAIEDRTYTCSFVHGPDWAPAPGTRFDVDGTYCLHTLQANEVTAFYHAGQEHISDHPCYLNFGLESYIGAPVFQGASRHGTLNFSSPEPRMRPFSDQEREFVGFLARWLGNELRGREERRQLRAQRSLFAAVIDAVPEAVIVADPDRRVSIVNPAVEELFGYTPGQLLGRQTAVLYEALDDYEAMGKKNFNPGSHYQRDRFALSCRRADGSVFEGAVSSADVRTEAGEHLGYLGVIRDVTEEKRFERAKDTLIATVSHELKNPLAALQGALRLLGARETELPEGSQKLLAIALRNATAIERMTSDILDLEKLRSDAGRADFDAIPLRPILERAIEAIEPYAEERRVRLSLAPAGPAPALSLHAERIQRLASNLISNAIKASPEDCVVSVGLTEDGLGFWVRDEGAGIPVALQPTLFERFSRAPSYRVDEGSGLGLSIVKAITDQHLGAIAFETAEGAGTTFTVRFPDPATAAPDASGQKPDGSRA